MAMRYQTYADTLASIVMGSGVLTAAAPAQIPMMASEIVDPAATLPATGKDAGAYSAWQGNGKAADTWGRSLNGMH